MEVVSPWQALIHHLHLCTPISQGEEEWGEEECGTYLSYPLPGMLSHSHSPNCPFKGIQLGV